MKKKNIATRMSQLFDRVSFPTVPKNFETYKSQLEKLVLENVQYSIDTKLVWDEFQGCFIFTYQLNIYLPPSVSNVISSDSKIMFRIFPMPNEQDMLNQIKTINDDINTLIDWSTKNRLDWFEKKKKSS